MSMQTFLEEARVAVRGLRRSFGFTTVAVLTLALGIAVNTTMFSVVDGVLLQPLAYRESGRLVAVSAHINGSAVPMAFPELFDLRDRASAFSDVAGDKPVTGNITGVDEPERIEARAVTGSFFTMLGVEPLLGRAFTAADEVPGIAPIGVISYGIWQRRFGGDATAIGRTVRIDDDDYTIVGVMPRDFEHPAADPARPVDFWFPSGFRALPFPPLTRWWRVANVYARLAPGVTIGQAQDELRRTADQWRAAYPGDYPARDWELRVQPLRDLIVGDVRRPLTILLAAVALVMLIACANVAGLQLARQATRASEVAVRQALGARRWQIVRPVLIESVLLSLGAAAVGVALAFGGAALARGLAPASMPRAAAIGVSLPVLLFAVSVAVVTGIAFGLAPALAASRVRLEGVMRFGARGAATSVATSRFRSALVIAELALALVLLAGAGLLVRSFAALHRVEPGFRADGLLTMEITVPYPNDVTRARYMEPAPRAGLYADVLRRTRTVPGVADAAMTGHVPLASATVRTGLVTPEGAAATTDADRPRFELIPVSDGYFRTMGIPLVRGREFSQDDGATAPEVAIVSASAARRMWPDEDPIGRRLAMGGSSSDAPWITVVGLVQDVRSSALDQPSPGQIYASSLRLPPRPVHLVVRARGAAEPLAEPIRRAVRAVEPDQPVYAVRTMTQILASRLAHRRVALVSLATFSGLAIVLAAVGLYGVISFTVGQRRREIGLRMALGSTPRAIALLVLRDALRLAVAAIVIGLVGVRLSARALSGVLYGVTAADPQTLVLTALGIMAVGMVASLVPGRRAAAVDPIAALREE